jgi:hypothetical protein
VWKARGIEKRRQFLDRQMQDRLELQTVSQVHTAKKNELYAFPEIKLPDLVPNSIFIHM